MRRVEDLEPQVWEVVSDLLANPEQLRADLDRMIELERSTVRGAPDREQEMWLDKLAEVNHKRTRYQEMAADDLITFDELRAKLAEIDETRSVAERELEALRAYRTHVVELETDRDALLDSLENVAPDALESLTAEERHHVYKTLRLRIAAYQDDSLELSGTFGETADLCQTRTLRAGPSGRAAPARDASSRRGECL
jgi:hypothetical protein